MSSDTSGSGYETPTGVPSKKQKRKYSQKYSKSWENDEEFKKWLKSSKKSANFAYCGVCKVDLTIQAGKTDLRKHANSKKHKENCVVVSRQPSVFDMPGSIRKQKETDAVKTGEIRIASFVAEHDLPFTVVEHIPKLIQAICTDSEIAKQLKCGRTKATAIVKNVCGLESISSLIQCLQQFKFSLIVDESTDKGCVKHLCLIARTMMNEDIQDCFLGLIPVQDGSADVLHANIVNFFEENNIPYKNNMLGFAADGANAMLGPHHSLSSLLKNDIPRLFIMKCICHSYALCASYACLKLPRGIEDLARDVYSYFSCSPKRQGTFQEFQEFVQAKPHKLLHPCQTRWLSLESVVSRLLEQYNALRLYFTDAVVSERLLACENILQKLNDPTTKLYLQFLEYVLPIFNMLNKQMQSESPQIHILRKSVIRSYTTILECYLQDDYVQNTPVETINPRDPHNFKELDFMYLGVAVEKSLSQPHLFPQQAVQQFKLRCLDFLIEAAVQISKRFPMQNETFKHLEALDPAVVKEKSIQTLAPLMMNFPSLVSDEKRQKIDTQWRILRNTHTTIVTENQTMTPIKFWMELKKTKTLDETPLFPDLAEFMLSLLCLPHSSAAAERVFSSINRMKTKTRNRLTTATISGLLHTKRLMLERNCYDLEVTRSMLSKMNSEIYKSNDAEDM